MASSIFHLCCLFLATRLSAGQSIFPQNNTFNSTFQLTPAQQASANLSDAVAHDLSVAIQFERSNQAGSYTFADPFYELPDDYDADDPPPAGTPLKVEQYTNVTLRTLPMGIAMSRFLYMTETLNGSSLPASAYVLWPYRPRHFSNLTRYSGHDAQDEDYPLFPTFGLAHGTSGFNQACAPSNLRALWGDTGTSFPLVLAGYAVVAPDYLGLGIANLTSPYFVLPSQANDLFRAIEAAQKTWPHLLSKEFVIGGQSQGGGTTWAGAHRQALYPVEGYLGAVAASPFPNPFEAVANQDAVQVNSRILSIAQGLGSVYPSFQLDEWLTPAAIARLHLMEEINACGPAAGVLFGSDEPSVPILKDGWNSTESALWYNNVSSMDGRAFAGPMLVMQGTEDGNAHEPAVTRSVANTCAANAHNLGGPEQIEYVRMENITHVPVLYAGQHTLFDWIRARFEGRGLGFEGCRTETWRPGRGERSAEFEGFKSQTWFLEWDVYGL